MRNDIAGNIEQGAKINPIYIYRERGIRENESDNHDTEIDI